MSYFSQLRACVSRLLNSSSFQYNPPNAKCNPPKTLISLITDCSNQGKLLILNLTLNNAKVDVPLDFSDDDFVVFTAPYNSRCAFEICRTLPIDALPFVGVFFCPTKQTADIQLLHKIANKGDISKVSGCFRKLSRELYKRRDTFIDHELNRNIISDQDHEYEEVLRLAQKKEEEEKLKIEKEKEIEKAKEEKVQNSLKRYNSMPAPPPKDDPTALIVKFMIENQPPKFRNFQYSDPVKLLYDFVSVDFAPNEPKIKYGFPPKILSKNDISLSFAELKFAKKETVFVAEDDEYDEEEEE